MTERDSSLDELHSMGLAPAWIQTARVLGPIQFVEIWRTLDAEAKRAGDRYIYLPSFRVFLRYQRNRFIVSLADSGLSITRIQLLLYSFLREELSARHIARVLRADERRPSLLKR